MKRILSAAILAPCFIFIIIKGGITLYIPLFLIFCISIYELFSLAKKTHYFSPILVIGLIYMMISFGSFLALREAYSVSILLLFIGMIWLSDIGAYFVGKQLRGPKLIKEISPNKTWSGFWGALIVPAVFSILWVYAFGLYPAFNHNHWYILYPVAALSGIVTGGVGQAGDLLISYIKRLAGVKDSGHLIPGHGGILDRIDSMLLATPTFFILITLLSYVLS